MTDSGNDGRPPKGRRGLSLQRIVDAALGLIDDQGIGAASMRSVAARLDVEAMSLYNYVANRDELFDAIVERVVEELTDDPTVDLYPTQGWRHYLESMAQGVRRYARAHPHAFPVVATRPSQAPWVNPPLRSLRWIEAFLVGLRKEGFSDEQVLFAYRTFNSFLLGFLLLETGSMTLHDPQPGDGSFAPRPSATAKAGGADPGQPAAEHSDQPGTGGAGDPAAAVPGAISPTASAEQREIMSEADSTAELVETLDGVDPELYPTMYELASGLAQDRYDEEFETGLQAMLDRIETKLAD